MGEAAARCLAFVDERVQIAGWFGFAPPPPRLSDEPELPVVEFGD
jgi:hypothetical protein